MTGTSERPTLIATRGITVTHLLDPAAGYVLCGSPGGPVAAPGESLICRRCTRLANSRGAAGWIFDTPRHERWTQ